MHLPVRCLKKGNSYILISLASKKQYFIDSLNYFKTALRNVDSHFYLNIKKQCFPHEGLTLEKLLYIGKYWPLQAYLSPHMDNDESIQEKVEFLADKKDQQFQAALSMVTYCNFDVQVIQLPPPPPPPLSLVKNSKLFFRFWLGLLSNICGRPLMCNEN